MENKKKDKVIVKKSYIRWCLTCGNSRARNLAGDNVVPGYVFCIFYNSIMPDRAACNNWRA